MGKKIVILCFFFVIIANIYSQNNLYRAIYNGDIEYIYSYYINSNIPNDHFEFSNSDLRILRNTIYAKHGYIFSSRDLQEHFQRFSWYSGTKRNVENELSENERRIIRIIAATEAANPPSINDLIGSWETPAPPGSDGEVSGFLEININRDGTIDYMRSEKIFWFLEGTTFRSSFNSTGEFDVIENFRINFIEYDGQLFKTCTFFINSSTIFNGWLFYGPNRRPPLQYWNMRNR